MQLYAGGYLTFYMPEHHSEIEIALDSPATLISILEGLGIPVGDVQLVVINGKIEDLERASVNDQDQVKIFSAVDGG